MCQCIQGGVGYESWLFISYVDFTKDIEGSCQTFYNAQCNRAVSCEAQIGDIYILTDHTPQNKCKQNVPMVFLQHVQLYRQITVDERDIYSDTSNLSLCWKKLALRSGISSIRRGDPHTDLVYVYVPAFRVLFCKIWYSERWVFIRDIYICDFTFLFLSLTSSSLSSSSNSCSMISLSSSIRASISSCWNSRSSNFLRSASNISDSCFTSAWESSLNEW